MQHSWKVPLDVPAGAFKLLGAEHRPRPTLELLPNRRLSCLCMKGAQMCGGVCAGTFSAAPGSIKRALSSLRSSVWCSVYPTLSGLPGKIYCSTPPAGGGGPGGEGEGQAFLSSSSSSVSLSARSSQPGRRSIFFLRRSLQMSDAESGGERGRCRCSRRRRSCAAAPD